MKDTPPKYNPPPTPTLGPRSAPMVHDQQRAARLPSEILDGAHAPKIPGNSYGKPQGAPAANIPGQVSGVEVTAAYPRAPKVR